MCEEERAELTAVAEGGGGRRRWREACAGGCNRRVQ